MVREGVGARRALGYGGSLEGDPLLGRGRPSRFEINVMGNWSRGRNAAKRTQFELRMCPCVIMRPRLIMRPCVIMRPWVITRPRVMMHMGRHARNGGGTEFQREGHAVRRHKAGGNIGAKQKQGQHQDAGPRTSSPKFENLSHAKPVARFRPRRAPLVRA